MTIAKDALSIFIRSLPAESKFSIISFGNRFEAMVNDSRNNILDYSDVTRDFALSQIQTFHANFGGTNILDPLRYA